MNPLRTIIKPRTFLLSAFAVIVTALPLAAAETPRRPNILFILADDLGIGDVKCFSKASKVMTPNIDRLASQGLRFTQAYAPGSVCSPSRYALMTGAYPCRGPLRDKPASISTPLTIGLDTLTWPKFLKNQGYRTAHIGKWHLGYGETGITNWAGEIKPGPLEIGFDYHLGLPTNHNDDFKTYVENHRLLWIKDGVTELPSQPTQDQLTRIRYDDEVDATLTSQAIEFMQRKSDQPFFIYLALVAPHTHITPHVKFRGTSQIGQLGDYINELDSHVGEIMATLDLLGIADNTMVFFASDNGGQRDDHKSAGRNLDLKDESHQVAEKSRTAKTDAYRKYEHRTNGELRDYKASNFEGGFRVPFIVRWPGKIAAGTSSDQIVTLADLLSTTAGLLGQPLPDSAGLDSFDMSSVMLGKTVNTPIRTTAILQTGRGLLAFRDGDWKLRFSKVPTWDGPNVSFPEAGYELYNLVEDWRERNDVSMNHPDRVKMMQRHLLEIIMSGRSR